METKRVYRLCAGLILSLTAAFASASIRATINAHTKAADRGLMIADESGRCPLWNNDLPYLRAIRIPCAAPGKSVN